MTELERIGDAEFLLDKEQAESLNSQIRQTIQELEDLLAEFISGQGWLALGFDTAWEWWNKEIGERRLGGSTRDKVILQFKKEEVSQRKIAKAVGVSPPTVRETLRVTSGRNLPPSQPTTPVVVPTEILDPLAGARISSKEGDWNPVEVEKEIQKFEEDVARERAEKVSVPFDIPNDRGIFLATESVTGQLDVVKMRVAKDLDSKTKAKLLIELQVIRDMIDLIENML